MEEVNTITDRQIHRERVTRAEAKKKDSTRKETHTAER